MMKFGSRHLEAQLQTTIRTASALALVLVALAAPQHASAADSQPAHGLAMHGDLKYPAGFTHFEYVNPEAPKGGELRRATTGTFDSFNPFIVKGLPAAGLSYLGQSPIYDSLMVRSFDEPFSQYGLLAETIETPPDRSWVAFTLREGARWHDGRPISVDDVIWSFNTMMEKGSPMYSLYFGNVERVEKVAERTVKFSFVPGENRELPLILGQIAVLPKHYWEKRDFSATTLEPPLGSGAYEIDSFEAGRFVKYKRRRDYWAANLPVNRGQFNFDSLRFDYYRDLEVAVEAIKGDAYDFRLEMTAQKWATAYDIPAVRSGRLRKELIPNHMIKSAQGFVFNLRRPVFQDRQVRWALAHVFDFEWTNKTLFYDSYVRTSGYFEGSELAAVGLPSPAELEILEPLRDRIPPEVFTTEYRPPATDGSGNHRKNLRTAVELLKEAGWKVEDGKLVHMETSAPMAFEILLQSPSFERVVLPFKKSLERIGAEVTVRTVDTAQYRRRLDNYDFDLVVGGIQNSESPGNEQREYWGSEAATRPGGRNIAGVQNSAIDELIELIIAAPDREALVTRCRAMDRVLQWEHYEILHWHLTAHRLVHWDRFGKPDITPTMGIGLNSWWFDPSKAARLGAANGTSP
jgi:microcin C transport system substrate-binding protein